MDGSQAVQISEMDWGVNGDVNVQYAESNIIRINNNNKAKTSLI